jgi:ATPase, P-type (transporting), HAD superfamily, subfamily IC
MFLLIRIIASAALWGASYIPLPYFEYLSLAALVLCGYSIVWEYIKSFFPEKFHSHACQCENLDGGLFSKIFDERLLMIVASIGAIILGDFHEGALIMMLFVTGEALSERAEGRALKKISALAALNPDFARVGDEQVDPNEVEVGTVITILPGERVPLDCEIVEGSSSLDTSALTGESEARAAEVGDALLAGMINLGSSVSAQVTALASDNAIQRIIKIVRDEQDKKTTTQKFITKFAKIYTPIVVGSALLMVVIGLLLGDVREWGYRGLVFLTASCPCALIISVPLAFVCSLGSLARRGVLVKGQAVLQDIAKIDTVAFDKTGTLTTGVVKGGIVFGEENIANSIKADVPAALAELKQLGVKKTAMVSGDKREKCLAIGKELVQLDEIHYELLPENKSDIIAELKRNVRSLAYVGDGINDAPALAAAHVGISIGDGTAAAIETSDAVLLGSSISGIPAAIRAARRALITVKFNIAFALASKAAVLVLAAIGIAPLWLAVLADSGVTLMLCGVAYVMNSRAR